VTIFHLVQHGEKHRLPGDPGLTDLGRRQVGRTAVWLREAGVTAVFSSPMRRARETADAIASLIGVPVREDTRLRERIDWDGSRTYEEFLTEWAATVRDRDFVPQGGDSSRQAGERFRSFLADVPAELGVVAACTHGGVTVDLLRSLAGDSALAPRLLTEGVPPCAITTLDGQTVVRIASVSHLSSFSARRSG
jgi:broad specificity phosphatase PhoE